MEIFMGRKILELEWVEHGGHKVVVTEPYNNFARRGIVTPHVIRCIVDRKDNP